jgi:hypothetical protein
MLFDADWPTPTAEVVMEATMVESNSDAPIPPSSMPDEWLDMLQRQDVATLDAIASYAQALADAHVRRSQWKRPPSPVLPSQWRSAY